MKVNVVQVAPGAPLAHPAAGAIGQPYGRWPMDQFTCALIRDGAVRRIDDDEAARLDGDADAPGGEPQTGESAADEPPRKKRKPHPHAAGQTGETEQST